MYKEEILIVGNGHKCLDSLPEVLYLIPFSRLAPRYGIIGGMEYARNIYSNKETEL